MSEAEAPTEAVSAATRGLDRMAPRELVSVLIAEQLRAVQAVAGSADAIAAAVDVVATALREGGTLHYFGAGTSGRLAVLDAAECPPTFGTAPERVVAHIAGGEPALRAAVEGAEDDAGAGREAARAVSAADVAVGISASGGAPYVIAAIEAARAAGAATIALTSNAESPLARAAERAIVVETGAEALSGSTRLGAGSAQKVVLSVLTTAAMVRTGHVYDNLMVDVVARNEKLRRRALRLVERLANADEARAAQLLDAAGGSVKAAVAMARLGIDASDARERLARAHGSLRAALGEE